MTLRGVPARLVHNERVLYTEVIFQAISDAGAMAFLSVFLVRLGASNWMVGLFSSLPALLTMISVMPAAAFVKRRRNLVGTVNSTRLMFRAVVALFALLPFFPVTIAPLIMVVGYSLACIPSAALNVAFTTLLGQATDPVRRPRLLSTRLASHGTVATCVSFLVGQWLDWAHYPLNYQLLFVSALVAGVGSVLVLSHFKQPDAPMTKLPPRARVGLAEMRALFTRAPAFRDFMIAALFFRIAMAMPNSLYAIYRVRTLGASDAWLGILMMVERFLNVVAYFALSRLLTNPKYRRHLWLTCMAIALYPLTMALARTPEMLIIPSMVTGIFGAGMNIYLTDTLLQVSPEDDRPTYVAANSFLANVAAFVGPMIGTALAGVTGIPLALGAIAGLRILSSLGFRRLAGAGEKQAEEANQALQAD